MFWSGPSIHVYKNGEPTRGPRKHRFARAAVTTLEKICPRRVGLSIRRALGGEWKFFPFKGPGERQTTLCPISARLELNSMMAVAVRDTTALLSRYANPFRGCRRARFRTAL